MRKGRKSIIIVLLVLAVVAVFVLKNFRAKEENKENIVEVISENPIDGLLKNGLPTVLDLGSNSCIPCKKMKPIFAELEAEFSGEYNFLILDISEYSSLANKYQVRVIPTQIFFDVSGKPYWRHEGYLSKKDILKKLEESGAKI